MKTDDSDEPIQGVAREGIKNALSAAMTAAPAGYVAGGPAGAALAAVTAGTAGLFAGGGSEMFTRAIAGFRSPHDAGFAAAHAELAARALEEAQPRVEERLRALEERVGPDKAASAVPPVRNAWARAWSQSEGKKQEVLMAAMVSAFDPESYEEAMAVRFIGILEGMDYPLIRRLVVDVQRFKKSGDRRIVGTWFSMDDDDDEDADEAAWQREQLAERGLMRFAKRQLGWTWIGVKLAEFLERGGYCPTPEVDNDVEP